MKINKPNKFNFSDSRLHPIFDKGIIQKIDTFNQVYDDFYLSAQDFKNSFFHSFLLKKDAKKIVDSLEKNITFYNPKKTDGNFKYDLWEFTKRKNRCEICGLYRKYLDKAHILKRSAYKNDQLKPKRAFKDYIDSIANILIVCSNCHSDLDRGRCSKTRIRHLVRRRKAANKRIGRFIQTDINYMNDVLTHLEEIDSKLHKFFNVKIRQFIRSRTDLPKKFIKKFSS